MEITVKGQTIAITDELLVENSQGVYECSFVFDSAWDTYSKTAVFQLNYETPIDVPLTNDVCIIPWEVLQHDGTLRIGVVGTYEDEVYPTLWAKTKIKDGTYTGVTGTEPTPSVYAQILDAYNSLSEVVNTKADASDLTALENVVNTKASQSDLSALQTLIESKADASDVSSLEAEVRQIQGELVGVDTLLGSGVIS